MFSTVDVCRVARGRQEASARLAPIQDLTNGAPSKINTAKSSMRAVEDTQRALVLRRPAADQCSN